MKLCTCQPYVSLDGFYFNIYFYTYSTSIYRENTCWALLCSLIISHPSNQLSFINYPQAHHYAHQHHKCLSDMYIYIVKATIREKDSFSVKCLLLMEARLEHVDGWAFIHKHQIHYRRERRWGFSNSLSGECLTICEGA